MLAFDLIGVLYYTSILRGKTVRQIDAETAAQTSITRIRPVPPKWTRAPEMPVIIAPAPNCIAPNNAEAVPAYSHCCISASWLPVGNIGRASCRAKLCQHG